MHPDLAKKEGFKEKNSSNAEGTIAIKMNPKLFKLACIRIATESCCSLRFFDSGGFRMLAGEISQKVNVKVNSRLIRVMLSDAAGSIRTIIKDEIGSKMFSLKIDIASRFGKSLLGINVQFIKNGKIIIRTIGMKTLRESHTASYLVKIIQETFTEYGLKIEQVYAFVTDNGANMIKTGRDLVNIQNEEMEARDAEIFDSEGLYWRRLKIVKLRLLDENIMKNLG